MGHRRALAHAAIDTDVRVAWFTLEPLTATIGRARVDASIACHQLAPGQPRDRRIDASLPAAGVCG